MTMRLAGGLPRLVLAAGLLIGAGLAPHIHAATAGAAPDTAHCVDASTLDLRRLLPPPPPAGSLGERAELDDLLHLQAVRTATEARLAQRDVERSVFRFADALGNPPAFNPQRLPLTTALFQHLWGDENAVLAPAKRAFGRPRPFAVEPRLAPITERPSSLSYPSGHSMWAYATALVLADLVPERRAEILARADQYAHNRNIAGVHYPSDVEAGRLAGTALAAMLFTCPAFEREEAAARRELRGALGLH
jgi:acid phosphatase (class A)